MRVDTVARRVRVRVRVRRAAFGWPVTYIHIHTCSRVYRTMGLPPPMLSYAALLLGARRLAMSHARGAWKTLSRPGRRMISGSVRPR